MVAVSVRISQVVRSTRGVISVPTLAPPVAVPFMIPLVPWSRRQSVVPLVMRHAAAEMQVAMRMPSLVPTVMVSGSLNDQVARFVCRSYICILILILDDSLGSSSDYSTD